jgi:tRNA1(Val) A37 N6-methylase TrmN6
MIGDGGGARDDELTRDTLLRGRVKLIQPARGYRSSLDPVLLAGFIRPPFGRFVDLGCGTGALSFLLLARDAQARGAGIEIQPRLAGLAKEGASANDFGDRFTLVAGDAREPGCLPAESYDLVATNPPYRALDKGTRSPDDEIAVAHHEVTLTLAAWVEVAGRVLRPDGRLAAIYVAERLGELWAVLAARGFAPARLRFVRARAGDPARRVLVEAMRRWRGGITVEPALTVHSGDDFGAEVRHLIDDGSLPDQQRSGGG